MLDRQNISSELNAQGHKRKIYMNGRVFFVTVLFDDNTKCNYILLKLYVKMDIVIFGHASMKDLSERNSTTHSRTTMV